MAGEEGGSLPPLGAQWPVPERIRSRLRQVAIIREAASRLPALSAELVHVVDGSQAHVTRWLRREHPVVVTAHDIIPLLQLRGRFSTPALGAAARWLVERSVDGLRRADVLIAVSESTRRDLLAEAGIDPARVRVVRSVLPPRFREALRVPVSAGASAESVPMILHVGNDGFYKNRIGAVWIAARVMQRSEASLVLAGAAPDACLEKAISELGIGSRVTFETQPPTEHLVTLYRRASLLLFPSLYEGYGWPPLEAMAAGCPVVCSSRASLPEVVGDAALTGDPDDVDGMARLCLEVLEDQDRTAELRARGVARAATFTEERMKRELFDVYDAALESAGRRMRVRS